MNIEQKIDRLVTSAYNSQDRQKVDEIEFRSSLLRLANISKVDIPALVEKILPYLRNTVVFDDYTRKPIGERSSREELEKILTEALSDKKE